jgi:DNA-binding SARP family transcriptional activator
MLNQALAGEQIAAPATHLPLAAAVGLPGAELTIHVLRGVVSRVTDTVTLTGRELELLVALAVHRRPCTTSFLAEIIYGEDASQVGRNSVKVLVHRVRRKLPPDSVISSAEGYRLGAHVKVDLCEYERIITAARGRFHDLPTADLARLGTLSHLILTSFPKRYFEWSWFESIETRLSNTGLDLWTEVAESLLRLGEYEQVVDMAKSLSAHDSICEQACDAIIRAYLALRRRAGAIEAFRNYRSALLFELGVEPSPSLAMLFRAPRDFTGR